MSWMPFELRPVVDARRALCIPTLPRIDRHGFAHPLALRYAVEELDLSCKHAHNAAIDATWTLISGLTTGVRQIVKNRTGGDLNVGCQYANGTSIPSIGFNCSRESPRKESQQVSLSQHTSNAG